jgi:hypothetical protein
MSDTEIPDMELPDRAYQHPGNSDNDEDEEPVIPRDDNRPTEDDPATSEDTGTAQSVTNDAVAGEPVAGSVAPDDAGAGVIRPLYAENDLEDEEIDLDDTLEWRQTDSALADQLDSVDAGDLETAGDLDGPLSDYDALTDDQLAGTDDDPDRVDVTAHNGPDLNADDSRDDGTGSGID